MMKHQRSAILFGCTGSIGRTALKGIGQLNREIIVKALSAHSNITALAQAACETKALAVCLTDPDGDMETLKANIPSSVHCYQGPQGLLDMLKDIDADIVLNGIVGAAGLPATLAALETGKDVALANKESIVMAGQFLFSFAERLGRSIIPVDSEHSALYSLINAHGREEVEKLVITASGGPFRTLQKERFSDITVEQAIAHPTWKMGHKISVDSATLANKGLEVIEASYLFGFSYTDIEVTVHPQSIVHSLVRLRNGAVYGQMSPSDMTLPIMEALSDGVLHLRQVVRPLDFSQLTLSFEAPDYEKFPLLGHAFSCIKQGGSYCIAFNAADEVAVQAFLDHRCGFMDISEIVDRTLQNDWRILPMDYAGVLEQDALARRIAAQALEKVTGR